MREKKIAPGTAEDANRKFEAGAAAARKGKPNTVCPYAVGGWAFNHWMRGYLSVRP